MKSGPTAIEQYVIDYVIKLRKQHKLTQANIGVILGTSEEFVSGVERTNTPKKYNLNHIDLLADYFNLSPGDFLPAKSVNKENH